MNAGLTVRPARLHEAAAISRLNNLFAERGLMLRRTPDVIAFAIDDYVVVVDDGGEIAGCAALKEYSPSLAEVAAVAVSPDAHGRGVGRTAVAAVETLALKRGIHEVFALTLEPGFFEALGYTRMDRARYPEKIRRDCLSCSRRFACNETCFAKSLRADEARERAAAARERAAPADGRILIVAA
jgi:N-acetylglutamate synthase-like GNAT family acetyltransferase